MSGHGPRRLPQFPTTGRAVDDSSSSSVRLRAQRPPEDVDAVITQDVLIDLEPFEPPTESAPPRVAFDDERPSLQPDQRDELGDGDRDAETLSAIEIQMLRRSLGGRDVPVLRIRETDALDGRSFVDRHWALLETAVLVSLIVTGLLLALVIAHRFHIV